jgi:phosphatidylserine/phosphatidylglycerophosphate/cardiolipin synthase-like enzyme
MSSTRSTVGSAAAAGEGLLNQGCDLFCAETTVKKVEDTFKDYTQREDIAILMINQHVANLIRHLINNYNKARARAPAAPATRPPRGLSGVTPLHASDSMTGQHSGTSETLCFRVTCLLLAATWEIAAMHDLHPAYPVHQPSVAWPGSEPRVPRAACAGDPGDPQQGAPV